MAGITENEARVMGYIVRNFNEKNSINQIARKLDLSPNGAYTILKKLEKSNVIIPERISKGIYYKANLSDEKAKKLAEYVLSDNRLNTYSQIKAEDLQPLRELTISCILFGSVLSKGKEARDIDVLIVFDKDNSKKVFDKVREIKEMSPKKIHDVYLLREDLVKQIIKKDDVILDAIRSGRILWGSGAIVEAIKNGAS